MKKQSIIILLCLAFLFISACKNDTYLPQEVTEQIESVTEDNKVVHIDEILHKYIDAVRLLEDSALVRISGPITKDSTYDGYKFYVDSIPENAYGLKNDITFSMWEENVDKSFDVSFDEDFDLASLQQFVALTICVIEPTLSYSEAENEMRKIISEYDGNNISEVFEGEEYYMYVSEPYYGNGYRVAAVHKSEVNIPVKKTEFISMEREQMLSVLNEGTLCYVDGTVTGVEINFPRANVYAEDLDGNSYIFRAVVDNVLCGFDNEQQYRFYFGLTESFNDGVVYGGLRYYE